MMFTTTGPCGTLVTSGGGQLGFAQLTAV